jgi:hypothetical protein
MSRSAMSAAERACRSRLAKLVHEAPLLHGTLTVRQVTCGKPGCRCARGERHPALYLTVRRAGRSHQLFIPASLAAEVRAWVVNDRTVRDLLDRVWAMSVEKLEHAKRRP